MKPAKTEETIVLTEFERQRCEVWTRVMGYHRPITSFNPGKRREHIERRYFQESRFKLTGSMQADECA